MEANIWTRREDDNGSLHYEHIPVCADDLLIASKTPQAIADLFSNKYKFKLKGTDIIK